MMLWFYMCVYYLSLSAVFFSILIQYQCNCHFSLTYLLT